MYRAQEAITITRKAVISDFAAHFVANHELTPLQEIIEPSRPVTYGILKPGLHVEGGIPVIKVKDYPDGVIKQEGLLCTTPEIEREYRRSRLIAGDLLLSIRGTMGRIAEVPASLNNANITQDTARLSIKPEHDKNYVRAFLESDFIQNQIQASITGLAVKGINIGEVRKLRLPLPPRHDQERLAQVVQSLSTNAKNLESHLALLASMKRALLNGLLNGNTTNVQ